MRSFTDKSISIVSYLKTLIRLLLEDLEQVRPVYRVVDWVKSDGDQDNYLLVQTIGKAIYKKFTPQSILDDDDFLRCFAPLDVKLITSLALIQNNNPACSISGEDIRESIVSLRGSDHAISSISIADISKNMELIDNLSPRDALRLGYSVGSSEHINILQEVKSVKTPSNSLHLN